MMLELSVAQFWLAIAGVLTTLIINCIGIGVIYAQHRRMAELLAPERVIAREIERATLTANFLTAQQDIIALREELRCLRRKSSEQSKTIYDRIENLRDMITGQNRHHDC